MNHATGITGYPWKANALPGVNRSTVGVQMQGLGNQIQLRASTDTEYHITGIVAALYYHQFCFKPF